MADVEVISFIAASPEGAQFMRKLGDGRWRITLDTEEDEKVFLLSKWQHHELTISIARSSAAPKPSDLV